MSYASFTGSGSGFGSFNTSNGFGSSGFSNSGFSSSGFSGSGFSGSGFGSSGTGFGSSVFSYGGFGRRSKHSKKFTYNQKILLAKLYYQGWDIYEGKVANMPESPGGKPRPTRKQLVERWTNSVNALDGAEKTVMQVQQRVNDMKKRVRQYREQMRYEIADSNGRLESIREMSPATRIVDEAMTMMENDATPGNPDHLNFEENFALEDFDEEDGRRRVHNSRQSSSKSPDDDDSDSTLRELQPRTTFVPASKATNQVSIIKAKTQATIEEEQTRLSVLKEELELATLRRKREEEALANDQELFKLRMQLLKRALLTGEDCLEDEVLDEDFRATKRKCLEEEENREEEYKVAKKLCKDEVEH